MWTYVIAFDAGIERFMMVRSRKRGLWEMPGGGALEGEAPLVAAQREFLEETGHTLISREDLFSMLQDGFVFFGIVGKGDISRRRRSEIIEARLHDGLPADLAYPSVEYGPLIDEAKRRLLRSGLI